MIDNTTIQITIRCAKCNKVVARNSAGTLDDALADSSNLVRENGGVVVQVGKDHKAVWCRECKDK